MKARPRRVSLQSSSDKFPVHKYGWCRRGFVRLAVWGLVFTLGLVPALLAGANLSKSGTTAAPILEIPMSPRGLAMGSAVIANFPDGAVLSWNPALATQFTGPYLSVALMPWLVGTNYQHVAAIVPTSLGTVGAYLASWSMGDMLVRNEYYQQGTGEKFDAADLVIGLSYARNLTDHFAIGGSVKYIQERIWHTAAAAWALDFGTIFRIDLGNGLRIGTTLTNYGSEMQMEGRDLFHYHDPNESMDGNNENIISSYETNSWPLPLTFKIGLSTELIRREYLRWTVEVDAVHPSNNFGSLNCGSEILLGRYIALRGGIERIFLKDEPISPGIGLGLTLPLTGGMKAVLNYSLRDYRALGLAQSMALDFSF